jgi:hypothetical protein
MEAEEDEEELEEEISSGETWECVSEIDTGFEICWQIASHT